MPDLIVGTAAAIVTILFIREYFLRRKLSNSHQKIIEESRRKGLEIIDEATKKSQSMIAQSEIDSIKVVAEGKVEFLKNQTEYEKKFFEILNNLNYAITTEVDQSRKNLTGIEGSFVSFVEDLKHRLGNQQGQGQQYIQYSTQELVNQFQAASAQFFQQMQERSFKSMDQDLAKSRQEIRSYQEKKLLLIDQNIMSIMSRTLELVVSKKLTLDDKVDLVYESFEQAKTEKIFE